MSRLHGWQYIDDMQVCREGGPTATGDVFRQRFFRATPESNEAAVAELAAVSAMAKSDHFDPSIIAVAYLDTYIPNGSSVESWYDSAADLLKKYPAELLYAMPHNVQYQTLSSSLPATLTPRTTYAYLYIPSYSLVSMVVFCTVNGFSKEEVGEVIFSWKRDGYTSAEYRIINSGLNFLDPPIVPVSDNPDFLLKTSPIASAPVLESLLLQPWQAKIDKLIMLRRGDPHPT